jgi:hypothetical protein
VTTVFAPGSLETDPKKQNMALQDHAGRLAANADDIATNTSDIAALQAAGSTYLTKSGNLSGLANTGTAQTNLGATTVGAAVFTASSAGAARFVLGVGVPDVIIEDQKASGTAGGGLTAGVNTRTLNTLVRNASGTGANSLTSNQFELNAGTYYMQWSAPSWRCDQHQTLLRNVTDGTYPAFGTSEYSASATDNAQSRSTGSTVVTIASTKSFAMHHLVLTTRATNGAGLAASSGGIEVYTRVEIWRLA